MEEENRRGRGRKKEKEILKGGLQKGKKGVNGYLGTPKKKVGCTSSNVCTSEPCNETITAIKNTYEGQLFVKIQKYKLLGSVGEQ